jgi:hypothetical protein
MKLKIHQLVSLLCYVLGAIGIVIAEAFRSDVAVWVLTGFTAVSLVAWMWFMLRKEAR